MGNVQRGTVLTEPPSYPKTESDQIPPASPEGSKRPRSSVILIVAIVVVLLILMIVLHVTGVVGPGTNM